jgi:hypothetical protein
VSCGEINIVWLQKIISGGQTGVDRAALDFAIKHNIRHGGWVPKGRKAEDGPLPRKYHVRELLTESYRERTERNVLGADGTILISRENLTGGSALTRELAKSHKKPWIHIDLRNLSATMAAARIISWIKKNNIITLNVAGAKASKDPYIYEAVIDLLDVIYLTDKQIFDVQE